MRRYADPERCPDCLAAMPYGSSRCPSCGLPLEGPLASELFTTLSHADDLLVVMRHADEAASTASTATTGATVGPGSTPAPQGQAPGAPGSAAPPADPGALATLLLPAGQTPAGQTPTGQTPAGETPTGETPTGQPPAAGSPPTLPPGREPHRPRGGLAGASVPRILLALGALCLLIAALVFLAVTWSALGVAGRTAALMGFTAATGVLTAWAARRDLRAAAESLGVVTLGLLAFDLVGARSAGWLGDPSTATFLVALGTVIATAGATAALAARGTPAGALVGAEVVATAGVATAAVGVVSNDLLAWSAGVTVVVLLATAVAFAANTARLVVLSTGAAMAALGLWTVLAVSGWDRALQHPSLTDLWLGLEVWPLLVAAALAAGLVLVRGLPTWVRVGGVGVAGLLLAGAVLAPAVDEAATSRMLSVAAVLTGLAALAFVTPQPWRRSLVVPGTLGVLWVLVSALGLAAEAVYRIVETGAASWTGTVGGTFVARPEGDWQLQGWLLPVLLVALTAALVAAARTFGWADRLVAPFADLDVLLAGAAGGVALTLALEPVPVWLVLAVLLVAATGGALRWAGPQNPLPLTLGALFLALALQLSLHDEWLTLAAVSVALAASAQVYLRTSRLEVSVAAGVVVAAALTGLAWTVGALAGAPAEWTALAAVLVLVVVTLGGPYVDADLLASRPAGPARIGLELGALAGAGVAAAAGVGAAASAPASWAAVYLTVAGAAASAMALLREDRWAAGWLGGLLLVAASWVRLADLGVDTPEAYTLPAALALVAVGLVHLRRGSGGTTAALTPGLALALVPSLLWALVDPVSLRSLLLGAACLALVVAGIRLRWSGPLVHGAVVGALLVLRHATPIAEAVPRWALIGAAGVLLVTMGITWEARVRDARRAAGYVRGLR